MTSAGATDVLVARMDAAGTPLTATFSYGGPGHESVEGLGIDDWGNVFVSGSFDRRMTIGGDVLTPAATDTYLASFRLTGLPRRARHQPGATPTPEHVESETRSVAVDRGGNLWFATYHDAPVDLGGVIVPEREGDVVLASYTTAGDLRTHARVTGSAGQFVGEVVADRLGRGLVVGYSYGTTEIEGLPPATATSVDVFILRHPE